MTETFDAVPQPKIVREEIRATDLTFPSYYRIFMFSKDLHAVQELLNRFHTLAEAEEYAHKYLAFENSTWVRAHIEEIKPVVRLLKNPR